MAGFSRLAAKRLLAGLAANTVPSRRLPPPGQQPAAGELADVEAAPARRCSPACLCAQLPHSSSASARRPLASPLSRVASSSSSSSFSSSPLLLLPLSPYSSQGQRQRRTLAVGPLDMPLSCTRCGGSTVGGSRACTRLWSTARHAAATGTAARPVTILLPRQRASPLSAGSPFAAVLLRPGCTASSPPPRGWPSSSSLRLPRVAAVQASGFRAVASWSSPLTTFASQPRHDAHWTQPASQPSAAYLPLESAAPRAHAVSSLSQMGADASSCRRHQRPPTPTPHSASPSCRELLLPRQRASPLLAVLSLAAVCVRQLGFVSPPGLVSWPVPATPRLPGVAAVLGCSAHRATSPRSSWHGFPSISDPSAGRVGGAQLYAHAVPSLLPPS